MTAHISPVSYQHLPEFFYSLLDAQNFPDVEAYAFNTGLSHSLGLERDWSNTERGLSVLSGRETLDENSAVAMAYGGHQFGHWSGLLGDGRARLAGEVEDVLGRRQELQLKGAGQTPYSRRGDGRATLGSAIREYVVSEAMAALGVPTTRSLSIVTTGENIMRNGPEPGAVLCRSARSHIRVGTFQLAAASGDIDNVKALADFAIERLYNDAPQESADRYRYFYRAVIAKQAELIAQWMGYGFIHGVMNTDNMCVSGETIDYGPCAFMDDFHPGKVFSSIDHQGRYAWGRQAEIGHWNLTRLAESILPLLGKTEDEQQAAAEEDLGTYVPAFQSAFNSILARKLGLINIPEKGDDFIAKTFEAMTAGKVDFTLFFRRLTQIASGTKDVEFLELFSESSIGEKWLSDWKKKTGFTSKLDANQVDLMKAANPIVIARNHRVEQAIADANAGNKETFEKLLVAINDPFTDRPELEDYETPPSANEVVHQTFCGT